jgi:prepilin-type N-terminal cleavage/methylation domain-containing protein
MRQTGTTLLELLAALAIGAVLIASGALGLTAILAHVRLAGAADALATALRATRVEALARHEELVVRFDRSTALGAAGWTVVSPNGMPLATGLLPSGVAIAEVPPRSRVRFGPLGTADNASIRLKAGEGQRLVVVNQRGRVQAR